jgi:hypothetical protein
MSLRTRRTLGEMVDHGHTAYAYCSTCNTYRDIDLPALIEKVGREYSLWNRRSRCRTEGCAGWMHYKCGPGHPHLMADEATEWRWFFEVPS